MSAWQQRPALPAASVWPAVALATALLGLVTYIAAPIGAVLGHVALRRVREVGGEGRSLARVAVLLGWGITIVYPVTAALSFAFLVLRIYTVYRFLT